MTRPNRLAVCCFTFALACSSDSSTVEFVDASPGADDDAGPRQTCNPVTQQGCVDGEKCASLVESFEPFLAVTTCVPDGSVPPGGDCSQGAPGAATGFDDCAADSGRGYHCLNGVCTEVCSGPPATCLDGSCVPVHRLFEDLSAELAIGVCSPNCDPTAQDCEIEEHGCFLNFVGGVMSCSRIADEAADRTQGSECFGPQPGVCFFNACAEGYGAVLNESPTNPDESVCAFFCNPHPDNLLGDPDGIQVTFDGAEQRAAGPGFLNEDAFECRWINSFYNNAADVPDSIGMAVPRAIWGTCADSDPSDPETFLPGCQPLSDLAETSQMSSAPARAESFAIPASLSLP